MASPRDTSPPPPSIREPVKPVRNEPVASVTGRSATVAEIGRELGDLDFEPDDLLASLRPFEPEPVSGPIEPRPDAPLRLEETLGQSPEKLGVTLAASALGHPNFEAHAQEPARELEPTNHEGPSVAQQPVDFETPTQTREQLSFDVPAPTVTPARKPPTIEAPVPVAAPIRVSAPAPPPRVPSPSRMAAPTRVVAPAPPTRAPVPSQKTAPTRVAAPAPPTRVPGPSRMAAPTPAARVSVPDQASVSAHAPADAATSDITVPATDAALPEPREEQITFESVSSIYPPHTISPPSLGHTLERTISVPDESTVGPDVTTAEELALLQELVTLPEERLEPLSFPHERPASTHLEQLSLTETFRNLAKLLASESQTNRHPQERAELSLVASELFAMTGQKEQAVETLSRTPAANIPLYATQLRQLSFDLEDLAPFAKLLRADLRASATHEARRHLMALYADVARVLHVDEAEQRRHLELSLRAFPTDPRFQLQRLASQLGDSPQKGNRLRPPAATDCLGYPELVRDLYQLRAHTTSHAESTHPLTSSLAVRQALEHQRFGELIAALLSLRTNSALDSAATWLAVTLGCHSPEHHEQLGKVLEPLTEQGDDDAELFWLEHQLSATQGRPSSVEVFSLNATGRLNVEDQLGLALAVNAENETIALLAGKLDARLETNPGLGALSLGTRQGVLREALTERIDRTLAAQLLLGTSLGSPQGPFSEPRRSWAQNGLTLESLLSISQCESNKTASTLTATLRLWHATHGESLTSTATSLLALTHEWPEAELPYIQVLSALLSELDGNRGQALTLLRQCHETQTCFEVVVRALATLSPDTTVQPLLEQLIASLRPSLRRSLLELELLQMPPSRGSTVALAPSLATTEPIFWPTLCVLSPETAIFDELLANATQDDEKRFFEILSVLSRLDESTNETAATLNRLIEHDEGDTASLSGETHARLSLRTLTRLQASLGSPVTSTQQQDLEQLATELNSRAATHLAEQFTEALGGDLERFEAMLAQAQTQSTPVEYIEVLSRAARLDPEREVAVGSYRTALAVTQRFASHLASLRTLLLVKATEGGLPKVFELANRIAVQLDRAERNAHAWLSSVGCVQALASGDRTATPGSSVELMTEDEEPPFWAVRRLLAQARQAFNDERIVTYTTYLRQHASLPLDAATLALRGAEAALRLQNWDDAEQRLEDAVTLVPEHLVALSMRAEFLEARGNIAAAARAFDALGQASCMPAHKVGAWLHAADLYTTLATSEAACDQATLCLEQVVRLDPTQANAQARLGRIYAATGNLESLETLLTQQLLLAETPNERATLELTRAQVLLKLERAEEARDGLQRALALNPDDEATLGQLTELLEADGQYEEAEQQLLRLASTTTNADRSVDTYRRLAALYETVLEHPTRAETAYREILRRKPADPAGDKLVALFLRQDNPKAAVELLLQLIELAKDTPLERDRTLELSRIYDAVLHERRRAEEVLEKARRRWTNDSAVLMALAGFFQRGKDHAALTALLDRSVGDARRALGSGRFEPSFFEIIATVGKLRELPDTSLVAESTLAALSGHGLSITGIGLAAVNDSYADLLAPDALSLPLRALLRRTGAALCATTPVDLRAMRAVPLTSSDETLARHLTDLAKAFGLNDVDAYVSPALGTVCQPIDQRPPTLVMGPTFVALRDPNVRDALFIRALRILSANAAALANTSPVDLWPLLGAYLTAHLPDFVPTGVDPKRLGLLKTQILSALPNPLDRDLPLLAADVAASIGNRASQLGLAVQQWGSRTALLALGDPLVVLSAIASAAGQMDRFEGGEDARLKWLVRNPEARDITVFSVTEDYLEARARAR